ncbi:hypothetical protein [uncultured Winogradskyella sp.]|jgi:hypothetical protein|uniref:hypothetical protein n=1 Tax=uncultured Winogradskyella sp. TaxID=395353 RepID=UPI0030DBA8A2|tara:strand:- start:41 stop:514 length:474 start_codon:yes stop_codon:yes gene_type:complete
MRQGEFVARRMSEAREKEFEELSAFLEFYVTNVEGRDRDDKIHPSNVLVKIVEQYGKSQALQGLKQAINDTIEDSLDFEPSQVSLIDVELAKNNLITLSSLRLRYWKKYRKIIERKAIRNETEFYLVVALVNDLTAPIEPDERLILNGLIADFEKDG